MSLVSNYDMVFKPPHDFFAQILSKNQKDFTTSLGPFFVFDKSLGVEKSKLRNETFSLGGRIYPGRGYCIDRLNCWYCKIVR